MACNRRGESLVELVVALVILEIVGAGALAAALTVERIGRAGDLGTATDAARWTSYRRAEIDTTCTLAASPDTLLLNFPATDQRPALSTLLRCGR